MRGSRVKRVEDRIQWCRANLNLSAQTLRALLILLSVSTYVLKANRKKKISTSRIVLNLVPLYI